MVKIELEEAERKEEAAQLKDGMAEDGKKVKSPPG